MAMTTAFMGQAMPSGGAAFTSVAIIFEPVSIPVGDFVYVLPLNWLRARSVQDDANEFQEGVHM